MFDSSNIFFYQDEGCVAFWAVPVEEQQTIIEAVKPFVVVAREALEQEEMPYLIFFLFLGLVL